MKISLLTIWHEQNYGAELQAYATIKLLKSFGHDVSMINIRLADFYEINLNGYIAKYLSIFTPAGLKFARFWRKYIPLSRRYRSIEELYKNPPLSDLYVVGSDQVWNPDITGKMKMLFFLDFGPDNVKRISFASSFGTSDWFHDELTINVENQLRRFAALTCRENSGVQILKNRFGVDAVNVLDPTLMLGDYSELIGHVKENKRTLVYYPLDDDTELHDYAKNLSCKLGLTLLNNNHRSYILGKLVWNRVGIETWIKNIAQAQFVITRSFHGLVFSLIYKRQFAIISSPNGRNARILDLLSQLNLSNRFFESFEELDQAQPWADLINYDEVTPILEKLRKHSIDTIVSIL